MNKYRNVNENSCLLGCDFWLVTSNNSKEHSAVIYRKIKTWKTLRPQTLCKIQMSIPLFTILFSVLQNILIVCHKLKRCPRYSSNVMCRKRYLLTKLPENTNFWWRNTLLCKSITSFLLSCTRYQTITLFNSLQNSYNQNK